MMIEGDNSIKTTPENKELSGYRGIFKATALFGGVQFWKILIMIVQTKFVALLLGPTGVGIKGLYTSATSLIQSISSLGIANSAVRDVSQASGSGDAKRVGHVIAVLRKLVWITGLLGMFVVIALSPVLSKTTFEDNSHIIPFVILSITLLFSQLTAGNNVLLQGTRKLTYLAKAGIFGSIICLFVTVPFYYFWGQDGIVPALVLDSLLLYFVSCYYSNKVSINKASVSLKETIHEGKEIVGLGLVMTYNSILVYGASYFLRIFITRDGGITDVGLYNAGFAVVNTYVGLIFTAMTTDYYPRLAAVNSDDEKCREIINQQIEVSLLILGPLMLFFIPLAPLAVIAIYSNQFLPIVGFMQWAALGMCFKAISWGISYLFIAKGDKKVFAINETIINLAALVMNILGYSLWGLTGLGIAYCVNCFLYVIIVFFVAKRKYGFSLFPEVRTINCIMMFCMVIVFLLLRMWDGWWIYIPSLIIIIAGCLYAFRELNKRMNIRDYLVRLKSRKALL